MAIEEKEDAEDAHVRAAARLASTEEQVGEAGQSMHNPSREIELAELVRWWRTPFAPVTTADADGDGDADAGPVAVVAVGPAEPALSRKHVYLSRLRLSP